MVKSPTLNINDKVEQYIRKNNHNKIVFKILGLKWCH